MKLTFQSRFAKNKYAKLNSTNKFCLCASVFFDNFKCKYLSYDTTSKC